MANRNTYRVGEVARATGYSTKRLDQLAQQGVCAPVSLAGVRIYNDSDVQALLKWRAKVEARRAARRSTSP